MAVSARFMKPRTWPIFCSSLSLETYDSVVLEPGPRLNLIIGPNGTGKSALMCAMCLGLAGKLTTIGRAQHAAEYIKHGKDRATIEIVLCDDDHLCVVKRVIPRDKGSQYMIDGKAVTHKQVETKVSEMHIQVNNLCQFLPQEKVADFAKMTPEELLENTEKAVGEEEMLEAHNKLKNDRSNAVQLNQNYRSLQDRLDNEKQKNERMVEDVKHFEERQANLNNIKDIETKISWMVYEDKRKEFLDIKEQAKNKEKELREVEEAMAPMKQMKETLESAAARHRDESRNKDKLLRQNEEKKRAFFDDIDKESEAITEIGAEWQLKLNQESERKKIVADMTLQMTALNEELANLHTGDVQPEIESVNKQMHTVTTQLTALRSVGGNVQYEVTGYQQEIQDKEREQAELNNTSNLRLQLLRQRHKHTYDAVLWLRNNVNRFSAQIHEPMFLTLNVTEPQYAKYVEAHIPTNDMRAFVCERGEDAELFIKIVTTELRLKVNVVSAPAPNRSFKPAIPLASLEHYGFCHHMRDIMRCPDAILRYNCLLHHVHDIPIGTAATNTCVERVIRENPQLRRFFTNTHQYNVKKSRYSGESSTRSFQISEAQYLNISVDFNQLSLVSAALQQLKSFLESKISEYDKLQAESKTIEATLNDLRNEKRALTKSKETRSTLTSRIQNFHARIQRKQGEEMNVDAERRSVQRKMRTLTAHKAAHLKRHSELMKMCHKQSQQKVHTSFKYIHTLVEMERLEEKSSEHDQALSDLQSEMEEMGKLMNSTKADAKYYLERAREATGQHTSEKEVLLNSLPNTVDELEALKREYRIRADIAFQTDETSVRDYYARVDSIKRMESELGQSKEEVEQHRADMENARESWLRPLNDLLSRININFSMFFSLMKCAGEVALSVPDDKEDYGHYGVKIRVKFRDSEKLTELNAQTQSGGERSVATVMYMMALQELTVCPFRCVDEINQGMDPTNERKVFEVMFKTVCERNSAQYFLLTPKLLTGLEYPRNVNVIVIHNGEADKLTPHLQDSILTD